MLSKEKCESALENLEEINLDIVLEELGYEKSERVSIYGINDYPTLEKQGDIEVIRELIKEHFEPQPYEFEDLKVGMWVWDSKEKKCNKIIEINDDKIGFYYVTNNVTRFTCKFEKNRFYPVQKANEVKEKCGLEVKIKKFY